MSPITDAHLCYIEHTSNKYPFYGTVHINARRAGKRANALKVLSYSKILIDTIHEEWLDEKRHLEALYASGDLERFKQDTLPFITKKLTS